MAVAWPLVWWHPLVWWLRRRVLFLAEVEADRSAIAAGTDVRTYGSALLSLAEVRSGTQMPAAVSALSSRSELLRRFTMFLRSDSLAAARGPVSILIRGAVLGSLVAVGASLWGQPLVAQDPTGTGVPRRTSLPVERSQPETTALPVETAREPVDRAANSTVALAATALTAYQDPAASEATLQTLQKLLEQRIVTYAVRPGDSIMKIARQRGVEVETIVRLNPRLAPNRIAVGQELNVPGPGWGVAQQIERILRDALVARPIVSSTMPVDLQVPGTVPEAVATTASPRDDHAAKRAEASRRRIDVQGGMSLETAGLLERYLDARGRVDLEKARLETAHTRVSNGAATELDVREGEIAYETARAKLGVLREVLHSRLELLKAAADHQSGLVKHSKLLAKRGFMTAAELEQDEQRLRQIQAEMRLITSTL